MKNKYEKYVDIFYILLLSSTFGASIIIGAFVAPSIFGSEFVFGGEILSKFQEGILMTAIFIKFNYFLNFVIISTILFEGYLYKNGDIDNWTISTVFIFVSTALLFTNYYTPQILEAQSLEITDSKLFENIHFASELDFKIFTFAILFLVVRKLLKLKK